ncbi:MAG: hypothetical protein V4629_13185 [Pseudomonadota bacterium]
MVSSVTSSSFGAAAPKLTKQQMLAALKAKANERQRTEGAEAPSQTIKEIESVTKPVTIGITAKKPTLRAVGHANSFLSRINPNTSQKTIETKTVVPFATIADPLVLAEADVVSTSELFNLEQNIPSNLKDEYEFFKGICSKKDIPAGMMGKLWNHLLNDITIISVDTSGSMGVKDVARSEALSELEQNFNIEVKDYGQNRMDENGREMNITPPQTRMHEAKNRFLEIMPILLAANRQGIVQLKSYSNTSGILLDMRTESYDNALNRANHFINALQPDLGHTPSVSGYYESCQTAIQHMRSGRVSSATIVEATDGVPNEDLNNKISGPAVKAIFNNYLAFKNGYGDYRREDGAIIPRQEALAWYMDNNTPILMRKLSVLAGHFAIPTTIAACTDNEREVGELDELDGLHNTIAVLDDIKSEQKQVIKFQGPRFPLNLPTYMSLYFLAPKEKFLDGMDERTFAPDELEQYLGYYPGHEAYVENLELTQTAVLAEAEQQGYRPPAESPKPIPTAGPGQYLPTAQATRY